jgi:hypothetical protein
VKVAYLNLHNSNLGFGLSNPDLNCKNNSTSLLNLYKASKALYLTHLWLHGPTFEEFKRGGGGGTPLPPNLHQISSHKEYAHIRIQRGWGNPYMANTRCSKVSLSHRYWIFYPPPSRGVHCTDPRECTWGVLIWTLPYYQTFYSPLASWASPYFSGLDLAIARLAHIFGGLDLAIARLAHIFEASI